MKQLSITLLVLFSIAACTPATTSDTDSSSDIFTMDEVSTHNSQSDCWMVIDGSVYDMTSYLPRHPGGIEQISAGCGIDASQLFATQGGEGSHSQNAVSTRESFKVGTLAE